MAKTDRICSVPDCDKPHSARGFCSPHYNRFLRYGDPLKGGVMRAQRPSVCVVEGCSNPADVPGCGRGFCVKHYQRYQQHGSPLGGGAEKTKGGAKCKVDGCGKKAQSHRYCQKHLTRLRKYGSTEGHHPRHKVKIRWIEKHSKYEGSDCLKWPFGVGDHGRGTVTISGKTISAPRAMALAAHGDPPTDQHQAAHICGNGHLGCMNPKHLAWKTAAENEADKDVHGTKRMGTDINTSRLTENQVRYIRSQRGLVTGRHLANMFGVTPSAITSVQLRKSWDWLD